MTDPSSYHVRPAAGWLNDPNGITRHNGRWHVFFQHNPAGPVHDAIAWGHVSSPDLLTWREHPVAFAPEPGGPDAYGCWTGVFVPGLPRPAVVYSGLVDASEASTVCLRWGSPDLDRWSRPEVVATTPSDAEIRVMRDPFVFSLNERRWALLGAGLAGGGAALLLFDCDDIRNWRYVGVLARNTDPVFDQLPKADVWECPQLVIRGDAAAIVLSPQLRGRFGMVSWVTGRLESDQDARPCFVGERTGPLDVGPAFYAPQLYDEGCGDPLLFGWVVEQTAVPGATSAGCLTLPRRLQLSGSEVHSYPDPATRGLLLKAERTEVAAGRHTLTGAAGVHITCGTAQLEGAGMSGAVTLPAGTQLWVDGAVAEVYPPDAPPITLRAAGPWVLRVPEGGAARVDPIAPTAQG